MKSKDEIAYLNFVFDSYPFVPNCDESREANISVDHKSVIVIPMSRDMSAVLRTIVIDWGLIPPSTGIFSSVISRRPVQITTCMCFLAFLYKESYTQHSSHATGYIHGLFDPVVEDE